MPRIQLRWLAHARSGDKGDTANVGLIALDPAWYPLLVKQVTRARVARHFKGMVKGVDRFELPNLWDIAGGVMLVQASGATVLAKDGETWAPFEAFDAPAADDRRGLSGWRQSLIIGRLEPDALVAGLSPVER